MRSDSTPAITGILLAALASPAAAAVFTFAPGAALPSLEGSTFSADTIHYSNSVFSIVQADATFVSHRILDITGFTLNGAAVNPAGFGSLYGLYIDDTDIGNSTPTSLGFSGGSIRIYADPGNNNGAVAVGTSGIGFTNGGPSGTADDILLATGAEQTGTAAFNPATGVRTTYFTDSYAALPDQTGFFAAPGTSGLIAFVNTTGPGLLINTPGPNGTTIQTITGATGIAQAVPEPVSTVLLGTGLLGLRVLRRQRC